MQAFVLGAGGGVTRTLRINPRREVFTPNVFVEKDRYMLNADNQNIIKWDYWLNKVTKIEAAGRLFISLSAREYEDCTKIANSFEQVVPPSAYEINFSCSHSAVLYGRISYDTTIKALAGVRDITKRPIFLKLSLDNMDFGELKKIEAEKLVDGYVLSNSIGPGLRINIKTHVPFLKSVFGGMSGNVIKPLVLAGVHRLYEQTELPIIGVGGINTAEDVIEYLLAGASAVQVYTAAHLKGVNVFKNIYTKLGDFLTSQNMSVEDLVGNMKNV